MNSRGSAERVYVFQEGQRNASAGPPETYGYVPLRRSIEPPAANGYVPLRHSAEPPAAYGYVRLSLLQRFS